MKRRCLLAGLGYLAVIGPLFALETLPPLEDGRAPRTHEELWAGYDPRAEPLDVEILKAWEEDGVVLQVLRYHIGIFKGRKAMMAAVYGYPKGETDLPGLVQIHGGGQYADYRAPLTNGKRGYATISIAWAGRINAPGYRVTPAEVHLFWENRTEDPLYRLTTDWGALDGYHAPTRYGQGSFGSTKPAEWTLDPVDSPRNDPWFLCTLGARRALTFLERQPEVDKTKLGVYGHSMGGKLTVQTAGADSRVRAAVPSCGGISDRSGGEGDRRSPTGDGVSLEKLSCPILFQSPANDFHGRIHDLPSAVADIQSSDWRLVCAPHHNHQDTSEYEVAGQLWFDQHLCATFVFPETPRIEVTLRTKDGIPTTFVNLDDTLPVLGVDVYYTRHGRMDGVQDDRENTKNRFWHYAATAKRESGWTARVPLSNTEQPLWVYANVTYALEAPISYAGYYYRVGSSETITLSSLVFMASADDLKAAGVKATLEPSLTIETFAGDWEKQWFTYQPDTWARRTHKIYDQRWQAPDGARLGIAVRAEQANTLVVGIDGYAAEVKLTGGAEWQPLVLTPGDFQDAEGTTLTDWQGVRELRLGALETMRVKAHGRTKSVTFGAPWKGPRPALRDLRWIPSTKTATTPDDAGMGSRRRSPGLRPMEKQHPAPVSRTTRGMGWIYPG